MAVPTFVGTPPTRGIRNQSFELQRIDYLAPEAGGRIGGVQAGLPLWKADWDMGEVSRADSDAWRAFMTRLRGAQNVFYGYDYGRQLPYAYQSGLPNGFNGVIASCTQSIDGSGNVVHAYAGLPSNFVLTVGDYVGFAWGTIQCTMVRLVSGGTANSSGALSVNIEPALPSIVPNTATISLVNPRCLMRMMPGSDVGKIARRGAVQGGRLTAIQDLIP